MLGRELVNVKGNGLYIKDVGEKVQKKSRTPDMESQNNKLG